MEVRIEALPQSCNATVAAGCAAQVLEAADGAKATHDSWPAFHKSTVHTGPLLHDWDYDGILDILVATYDGEILAFKDTVRLSCGYFQYSNDIQRLSIAALWHRASSCWSAWRCPGCVCAKTGSRGWLPTP